MITTSCEICTLREMADRRVLSFFPEQYQYDLLIVGQAPGKTEIITGLPFTGGAGKQLFSCMLNVGLYKRDLPQANLIMCKPPSDDKGNDRAPTSHEIMCCSSQLKEAIWKVQPRLILALGTPASLTLTGKGPITQIHGGFFPLLPTFEWECQVLCCFHPSYVMRQRQMIPVMLIDLQKVHTFFVEGETPEKDKYEFWLDLTLTELSNYLKSCKKVVAFDTETTSLNPRKASLLGCSFSELGTDRAVAIYLTQGDKDPRWPLIKEWLKNPKTLKVTQNGQYDLAVCETAGVTVQGWNFDTMLAEQLINSDGKKDLNHLRSLYTDLEPYKPTSREMKDISSWGKDQMLLYAAKDALCTQKVMEAQLPLLSKVQRGLMQETILPVARVLNKMERVGIKVDVPKLALMYSKVVPTMKALVKELREKYQVNPDSPKQICERFNLENAQKETLQDWIKSGHPYSEALEQILDYKNLAKGSSTFLMGVYNRLEDGRIHSHYNASGTGTGRLSSSDPNLQNIQKRFRVIYIPDSPKFCFLAADYKQLELRIVACLSQDEVMLSDLSLGRDIHDLVTIAIDPYVPEKLKIEKDSVRTIAKAINFGTLFGRTAVSIAGAFGVPTHLAQQWQDIAFSRYEKLRQWQEERRKDVKRLGYVTTPFGRKRYIQNQRQAVNMPVQSTANEVNLGSLVLLDKEGLDLRLTTHDEDVVQVKDRDYVKVAKLMKEIMERPIPELGGLRFPVDIKVGSNWYELEEVEL